MERNVPSLFLPVSPLVPTSRRLFLKRSTCLRRAPPRAAVSSHQFESTPRSTLPIATPATSPLALPALPRAPLYDVAVIGAGPAGLSLAAALCGRGVSVVILDGALDKPWPNHYGVWYDEFEEVGLEECATAVYDKTTVYAGEEKIVLHRGYLRVDRVKLKRELVRRCEQGGVNMEVAMVRDVEVVGEDESNIWFENERGEYARVRTRLVVDCTGHALRFTEEEKQGKYAEPWEQAAYGIEAEVESYPYDKDEMLLMDFRDGHMQGDERLRRMSKERPTFLYVFPSGEGRGFFEETSVIAKEAVPFEELKERLYLRLAHDGVKVKRVIEEERSLIPMGGSLPRRGQRVVGFGGAACLVHPATGYMVARTVKMASRVAECIAQGQREGLSGRAVSERVWRLTWSLELRRQRDFLKFGAELLGILSMEESRRFFEAFFGLPEELWKKFLGFKLNKAEERVFFASYFFMIASWEIRWALLKGILDIGRWTLIRSALPVWMSAFDES